MRYKAVFGRNYAHKHISQMGDSTIIILKAAGNVAVSRVARALKELYGSVEQHILAT